MVEANAVPKHGITEGMTRPQIKDAILKLAQAHIDNWDKLPLAAEDKKRNFESRQQLADEGMLTVAKIHAEGFGPDHVEKYVNNMFTIASELNDRVSTDKVEEAEDHETWEIKMNMPWPMTNRTMYANVFKEIGDGKVMVCSSSLGT